MRVVIIVQARMTSSRLPGKVLMTVLNKPLLEYQIERLRRVKLADEIVIATTDNGSEQLIIELCERLDITYFRGSEDDVLSRYHGAALASRADVVVRITSDCPIIDPLVIDKVIRFYIDKFGHYDYVSNALIRSYPRGMDTEVFSFQALDEAFREATRQPDREHVTPFIYTQPQRYRLANVVYHDDQSCHRWTVDTPEDFELIRRIIKILYPLNPEFCLEDSLSLVKKHPEWMLINAHVEQKELYYNECRGKE
jgi:spore coat polysaccharide biosynthesis protein SpsF